MSITLLASDTRSSGEEAVSSALRVVVAAVSSIPLFLVMAYTGLIAVLTMVQQIASSLFDVSQASWTSFLNPAYLMGFQSLGGTGNIFDALVGGPGAPGGTVGPYVVFMVTGLVAGLSFLGLKTLWNWAMADQEAT